MPGLAGVALTQHPGVLAGPSALHRDHLGVGLAGHSGQAAGQYPLLSLLENAPGISDASATLAQLQTEMLTNTQMAADLHERGMPRGTFLQILKDAGLPIDAQAIAAAREMDAVGMVEGEGDGRDADGERDGAAAEV